MRCEPVSNYLAWGKDVGPWCTKNRVVHPRTLAELEAVQAAIAAGDPSGLAKVPDDAIPQADEPATPAGDAGDPVYPKGGEPPATPAGEPAPKKTRKKS
jgi:hypothetical protein